MAPKFITLLVLLLFFLMTQGYGQNLRTVISHGVGSDPQSAALNAAQNALTQVVGSFIDADTQIKKRTEVENGIRSETKQISRSIREYSQGSIRSFEILETSQTGQMFRVVAKVGVRVAELKAYINKLAEAETTVGAGLFAEVKIAVDQSRALIDLLSERIQAVADGKVQEFIVGKPIPYLRSAFSAILRPGTDVSHYISTPLASFLREGGDAASLVVVPVVSRLQVGFVDNLVATLNETATAKKRWSCPDASKYRIRDLAYDECLRRSDRLWGFYETKLSIALPDKARWANEFGLHVYKFDLTRERFFEGIRLKTGIFPGTYTPDEDPELRLSILSASNEELVSYSYRGDRHTEGAFVLWAADYMGREPPWLMLTAKHGEDIVILPEKTFYLVFSIDPGKLKMAERIKVSIEN